MATADKAVAGAATKSPVLIDYSERLNGLLLDENGERFCARPSVFRQGSCDRRAGEAERAIARKRSHDSHGARAGAADARNRVALRRHRREVAEQVGLDPAKVKATVERYNGFVEAGLDEDFGRSGEHLVPMTGPFYAAPVTVSTSMTIGGVKINTNGEALKLASSGKGDVTLEPVPGLYATGEVCSGTA
ncbi:MAG: FAD-binding protein [Eggerthella lenta]